MSDATEELKTGKPPAALTLDAIMTAAVKNISVRYNLSQAQQDLTDQMMKKGVEKFIKEHENEVWPVIGGLLRTGLGQKPPSSEDAMRIGKAARPLIQAARKYIYEANEEWRMILNDEQKLVHDYDLKDMDRQFSAIDRNIGAWADGTPGDRLFPRAVKNPDEPPRPSKITEVESVYRVFDPLPILETLVEEFIKEHKLSKGQITAARSILEEFKSDASDYQAAKKKELTEVAKERHAALDARDMAAVKKIDKKHKLLLKPIYQLCDAMTDRLEKQLTSAQLQRSAGQTEARSDAANKSAKKDE